MFSLLDIAWVQMEVGPEIVAWNGLLVQGDVKRLVYTLPVGVCWVVCGGNATCRFLKMFRVLPRG